jgi:hypothetical protein
MESDSAKESAESETETACNEIEARVSETERSCENTESATISNNESEKLTAKINEVANSFIWVIKERYGLSEKCVVKERSWLSRKKWVIKERNELTSAIPKISEEKIVTMGYQGDNLTGKVVSYRRSVSR